MTRAPSDATVRLLGWAALVGGVAFIWWILTFAAAGTGTDLPRPIFATAPASTERDPVADAWRVLNALLAGATLLWLWIRWFDVRCELDPFSKAGELVLFTAAFTGAVHAIIQGMPATVALPFVSLACMLRLIGLARTTSRRQKALR